MKKIGLLSDTHGYWDDAYMKYFSDCDEIWHAGDIGSEEIISNFGKDKIIRAVYGNADDQSLRYRFKSVEYFQVEGVNVMITHIGGYPGKYANGVKKMVEEAKPNLFVCGHSHIAKVMYDKSFNMLCLNPGAAGVFGFHSVRTLFCFCIEGSNIKDLEVIEIGRK